MKRRIFSPIGIALPILGMAELLIFKTRIFIQIIASIALINALSLGAPFALLRGAAQTPSFLRVREMTICSIIMALIGGAGSMFIPDCMNLWGGTEYIIVSTAMVFTQCVQSRFLCEGNDKDAFLMEIIVFVGGALLLSMNQLNSTWLGYWGILCAVIVLIVCLSGHSIIKEKPILFFRSFPMLWRGAIPALVRMSGLVAVLTVLMRFSESNFTALASLNAFFLFNLFAAPMRDDPEAGEARFAFVAIFQLLMLALTFVFDLFYHFPPYAYRRFLLPAMLFAVAEVLLYNDGYIRRWGATAFLLLASALLCTPGRIDFLGEYQIYFVNWIGLASAIEFFAFSVPDLEHFIHMRSLDAVKYKMQHTNNDEYEW